MPGFPAAQPRPAHKGDSENTQSTIWKKMDREQTHNAHLAAFILSKTEKRNALLPKRFFEETF